MAHYDRQCHRHGPAYCFSNELPSRSLSPRQKSQAFLNQEIRAAQTREYELYDTPSEEVGLIGDIAVVGLIAVPASYLSWWLAVAGIELAGAIAGLTVATSVIAAPYLVAGGAAYGTLQGGKALVGKGVPFVIAVAKGTTQHVNDTRELVTSLGRDQKENVTRPTVATIASVSDADSHLPAERLAGPIFFSSILSRPPKNIQTTQQEQPRTGTIDEFGYYALQLQDETCENDISGSWLRIDKEDPFMRKRAVDDSEWVHVTDPRFW